jgi:hypothetical protein
MVEARAAQAPLLKTHMPLSPKNRPVKDRPDPHKGGLARVCLARGGLASGVWGLGSGESCLFLDEFQQYTIGGFGVNENGATLGGDTRLLVEDRRAFGL